MTQVHEGGAGANNAWSWYMASNLDTNREESTGIPVKFGSGLFKTLTMRYTIFDAPGGGSSVPDMISVISQTDIGMLVISARKGEFETGYKRVGKLVNMFSLQSLWVSLSSSSS